MNKLLMVLGLSIALISCQDIPPDMSDRVALLESQSRLDRANYSLLVSRVDGLESRIDGAEVNIAALTALSSVVSDLGVQVSGLSSNYSALTDASNTLRGDVDSLSLVISSLSAQLAAKIDGAEALNLINTALSSYVTSTQLSTALTTNGAAIYQCRNGSVVSKEKILKVNGVFYAVMNYVTKSNITYMNTSGATTTIKVPAYCSNGYNDWLAYNVGSCNGGNVFTPAQNVVVASGTSATIAVVTGVQMALEPLTSGSGYVTTDNSTPCSFNGDGTNLEAL